MKLKTLLSILWVAVQEPHDVRLPARAWAQLIGLPDPGGRGAHRVNGALRQLVKADLLTAEARPGEPTRFYLLDESGSAASYANPGAEVGKLKAAGEDFSAHRYFRVPRELWTNGWIAWLNGPGLAMFLVLSSIASGRDDQNLWFSPGVADERYGLSDETRKRGVDCLRELGLVTVIRRPIARSKLEVTRLRNTYSLKPETLLKVAPSLTCDGLGES